MPKNLEIKARMEDLRKARQIAERLPARFTGTLKQTDTYFNVKHGRLKLREIYQQHAELIYYHRIEDKNERVSDFQIYSCEQPHKLKAMLEQAVGILAVVKKRRDLFMYKKTRIHLDVVDTLGTFLELETPFDVRVEKAQKMINYLIRQFELQKNDYISHSYLDLILTK